MAQLSESVAPLCPVNRHEAVSTAPPQIKEVQMSGLPSADEVIGYMKTLSNWGRWGPEDTKGTLNLISSANRRCAGALVTDGESISLSKKIPHLGIAEAWGETGPRSYMIQSGERYAWDPVTESQFQMAVESLSMIFHGELFTHIDDMSHVFYRGKMYNGRPSSLVTSADGAKEQNVDAMRDGVFTRGILFDFARFRGADFVAAGDPVLPEHLDAMEEMQGVRVMEGDAVLLRTGYQGALDRAENTGATRPKGHSGWSVACLPWFRDRGVSLIGADVFNEANPTGYDVSIDPGLFLSPVHVVALVAMGLPLLDNTHLEHLAEVCAAKNRWEFCFVVNPLRLDRGTGSPVNPIAVF